jgi:hypothetical protein
MFNLMNGFQGPPSTDTATPFGVEITALEGATLDLRIPGEELDAVAAGDEVGSDAARFVDRWQPTARVRAAADEGAMAHFRRLMKTSVLCQ